MASLMRLSVRRVASSVSRTPKRNFHDKLYADRLDYPAPNCRFVQEAELSAEMQALKVKERGDWKALTQADKKELYRMSFNKTYSEMRAPTGEWKYVIGGVCIAIAVSGVIYGFQKAYISPPLPHTMSDEWQEAQLRYQIAIRNGPVTGIASQWDYEKNEWKK
ncbi:cytochrome c oxidase subunit 4 isoform 1, mitochondrial [Strongylocentrotus purpuratus]|uniref:Cytochrome c oxidase subunit 4 n=1 Tax=Strongylocentrotus purpuratus TaxID=7668 RepID=A0A7M7LVV0_STRPU|nr:cytochrome c oxidase subunit 4 isoform 1, mitochondrial [Strongylocentrotus purpuratus]|eukprot:XP_011667242.1 PREDICTED: cytochrome c oxidase subunit 4 isoform 1, mitochondrial [Strongylocentrotus purpuratus]